MATMDIYAAPEAEIDTQIDTHKSCAYFPTSILKMVVLFIATMGMYSYYWHYKHWKYQQAITGEKLSPVLRTLFGIFFYFNLFSRIKQSATEKNIESSWSPALMAAIVIGISLLGFVSELIHRDDAQIGLFGLAVFFLSFLVLLPKVWVQRTANRVNEDPEGELNREYSWRNIIFIVLGVVWWALALLGFYAMFNLGF